ncbi:MAG: nuclear transport factor 2 family protein [Phycisphaerales bacterium]
MSTNTPLKQRVDELISYINEGKILEAMDEFYDESIEMRENNEPPTVGLAANIEREKQFLSSVADWKWTTWHAVAVNEDDQVAMLEYAFEFVDTSGKTVTYEQATVQRWRDGKIIAERFYHG